MDAKVILITPDVAQKYLERNKNNRPLKQKAILYYSNLMLKNKWEKTGQSISLTPDNQLLDGQHRLHAIVKSGKSQETVVVFNVEKDTFPAYDSGKTRNGADALTIEGVDNGVVLSAAMAKYLLLKIGRRTANGSQAKEINTAKRDYIQLYYEHDKKWEEFLDFSGTIYSKRRLYPKSIIIGYSAHLIFDKGHPENKVMGFFRQLVGIEPDQYSGTRILRDMIIDQALTSKEMTPKFRSILLIKAWNSYISQQNVKRLKHIKDDAYPVIL